MTEIEHVAGNNADSTEIYRIGILFYHFLTFLVLYAIIIDCFKTRFPENFSVEQIKSSLRQFILDYLPVLLFVQEKYDMIYVITLTNNTPTMLSGRN